MELTKHIWFCEFLKFFLKKKYLCIRQYIASTTIPLLVLCLGNQSGSLDVD